MTSTMTTTNEAALAEVLGSVAKMTERYLEFEAAMASGDEKAVREAVEACYLAKVAWVRIPHSFEEGTPEDRAHTAAIEALDELEAAPVPAGPDNKGATVLAAAMAEISAASAALDAAQASVTDIDEEIEGAEGDIELLQDLIDSGDDEYIGRLARTKKRLAELKAQRVTVLGSAGEDPLGFWEKLRENRLSLEEWHAIDSYQRRMVAA